MDLLIVGESTDQLATAIQDSFAQLGKQVSILDPLSAAQLFTIVIRNGQVSISPDIPMILRPVSPELQQPDFDQSFHHSEALSTLWMVATACQSPVLNRPTPKSMWGQASFSSVLMQQRASLATGGSVDTKEQFTSRPPQFSEEEDSGPDGQAWFVQDMGNSAVAQAPAMPEGQGPYRSRQTYQSGHYEVVVVMANRAWRSTQVPLDELELERRSIQLLRNLDLDFGVVVWKITEDLQAATIAKVDMFPTLDQVALVWPALRTQIYQEIFE